jgi:hypothetical protein
LQKPRKVVDKDFYATYPYNNPNIDNYVDKRAYKKILVTFFDNLIDHLIETGDTFQTPSRMGKFYVKKFRSTKSKLNYQAWKNGKYQLYTNQHSFGYSVRLCWEKNGQEIKYGKIMRFTPVRKVSRKISKQNQINNYIHNYRG